MEKFLVSSFFDIEEYAWKELFESCRYAWEPLGLLRSFFEQKKLGKIACDIPSGVHLVRPELIHIGSDTIIEPGVFIQGPCIIGNNCEIRHGANLRGFVLTGDRCLIGHATELKASILLDDVCAAHFNYVGDSILGNRVNLGAGVKLANLRLDREDVEIFNGEEKISTHLKKMGAILGDGVQMGCNAVTNPGTIMGKKAFCYPNLTVKGFVPERAKIRSTQKMVIHNDYDRSCF